MKQFIQVKLFSLLKSQAVENIPVSQWEESYEAFANQIFAADASFNSRTKYLNALRYAFAELAYLQERKDLKKNGIHIWFFTKSN